MSELKPCPFCGGEARNDYESCADNPIIQCQGCRAIMPDNTAELAIAAWNRRSLPEKAAAEKEFIEAAKEVEIDDHVNCNSRTGTCCRRASAAAERFFVARDALAALDEGAEKP